MADDLDRITSELRSNPKDPVTVQALADWLEERGAAPESVRVLTVDGPTVLVFGWPDDAGPAFIAQLRDTAAIVSSDITQHTGCPVCWVVMPASVTIRAIRGSVGVGGAGG